MHDLDMASLARDLMRNAEAVVLTTVDGAGRPQSRAMLNLLNAGTYPALRDLMEEEGDSFVAWFTTNTSSRKMLDLRANRAVSAYYCRPSDWRGLTLGGDMEIIEDEAAKRRLWQPGWEMYYPLGPSDPDYAVLRLRPTLVKYYHQLRSAVLVGLDNG
ncbi:MAG TPA: pyridoxamine 5'-phosphate oxidase family protein [Magnetospirillum sp.]|nr:pyridoxamine 5'-phosphate oxidase family protein [Magnetospirillum sp.]